MKRRHKSENRVTMEDDGSTSTWARYETTLEMSRSDVEELVLKHVKPKLNELCPWIGSALIGSPRIKVGIDGGYEDAAVTVTISAEYEE